MVSLLKGQAAAFKISLKKEVQESQERQLVFREGSIENWPLHCNVIKDQSYFYKIVGKKMNHL